MGFPKVSKSTALHGLKLSADCKYSSSKSRVVLVDIVVKDLDCFLLSSFFSLLGNKRRIRGKMNKNKEKPRINNPTIIKNELSIILK